MLNHLKSHLKGKVVILGIGNTLHGDDGAGSILAQRLKDKVPFIVWDAGTVPENFLEKIVREKPDNIVIVDAADFGGAAGEFRVLDAEEVKTTNLFSTHNGSISLLITYLEESLKSEMLVLAIQPKTIALADDLSQEVESTIDKLEGWFFSI